MSVDYYNGGKLLSLKDKNGNQPEIFICVGNRTAGKTYFFKKLLLKRFIEQGKMFIVVYRFSYELASAYESFFTDLCQIDFPNCTYGCKSYSKGLFYGLLFNEQLCGFAISLSSSDGLRKFSSTFVNCHSMFFDEFQSELGKYVHDEVKKLQSIHTSIARGEGKQTRFVPIYMCSNNVSVLNPYYTALGITNVVKKDTKFLRGLGFVLEQAFNASASAAMKESAFNKAFEASTNYLSYAADNVSLNDNDRFIGIPSGNWRYKCSVSYYEKDYAIWECMDKGLIAINHKVDSSHPFKLCFTTVDHDINYLMLENNSITVSTWRRFFMKGLFRFEDLECKNMLLDLLAYR